MRTALLLSIGLLACCSVSAADSETRGAYLATAAGCKSCHTDSENDGAAYAGGYMLETPYGNFITPNITSDRETGIGGWTDSQFLSALHEGISPDGDYYYPAFPYASYAGMAAQDALDIKAYLDSLSPVVRTNRDNELKWLVPGRWAMGIWQWLFMPWQYPAAPAGATAQWSRGAYLVRHLSHCGECHTPRNSIGALDTGLELQGVTDADAAAPDITADRNDGIGSWSGEELEFFLEMGMYPDGDFVGGDMVAVIDHTTTRLTGADRKAIVHFLRSLVNEKE
jgi:mono/diheme cytochrome c family protein